jgi:hypothetical protein
MLTLVGVALVLGVPTIGYGYSTTGERFVYNTNYCYYDSSIPSAWQSSSALGNARSAWNNAGSPFQLYYQSGSANYMFASNAGNTGWTAAAWHTVHPNPNNSKLHSYARIQFNTYYPWTTSGASNAYDVCDNATHEIGHWLLLKDQYSGTNTMYGYSNKGQTFRRTLATDDVNGVNYLY